MMTALWTCLSCGERYLPATLMYLGLGLAFWGAMPDAAPVLANCNGAEEGCPAGQKCCGGNCVPEDYVCCEDGSSGHGRSCYCCSGCEDSDCTDPTTQYCPEIESGGE